MAFELNLEVMAQDINAFGEVSLSNIVKYLQEAVDRNLKECHPTYEELLAQNLSFIVSKTAIKVHSPLRKYDKFTVSTWATKSKSATFLRNYNIICDEKIVAECVMSWALINIEEHRLLRGSEFDVSSYGCGELIDLNLPSRLRVAADAPLKKCGEEMVCYSDIDRNMHMNNTKYFDMLLNYIPNCENLSVCSCVLNYVKEAAYKKAIEIYSLPVKENENGQKVYSFVTKVDGEINTISEFTVVKR